MAHARGVQFRLDEINSVACSGKAGVSDTFASALWMLDTLFNMASVGVDAINIHSLPGSAYELFTISHPKDRWQAFVHPDYYGMLMFEQAFPPGAQLLQVSQPDGPVKVWATRGTDGRQRIVIINQDPDNAQTVQLSVPGAGGAASLDWLKAPSLLATNGRDARRPDVRRRDAQRAAEASAGRPDHRDPGDVHGRASGRERGAADSIGV